MEYQISNIWIAVSMLVASLIVFWVIGWYSSRLTQTLDDLYVAGRRAGPIVNGCVMSAMFVSLSMFLGGAALIMQLKGAIMYMWLHWVCCIPLIIVLYGTHLYKLGITSPVAFIRKRFGDAPAVMAALIIIFALIMYSSGNIIGLSKMFEVLLDLPYMWGLFVIAAFVVGYVVIGGQIGATYNVFIQNVILMLALLLPLFAIFYSIGSSGWIFPPFGYQDMVPAMLEVYPDFFDPVGTPRAFFGLTFSIVMGEICLVHLVLRVFSAPSIKKGRQAVPWYILSMGITAACVFAFSFVTVYHFQKNGINIPARELDKVVLFITLNYTNQWLTAFVIAGAFAAGVSALNGQLLANGMLLSSDIFGTLYKNIKESWKLYIGYAGIALSGLGAVLLAAKPPNFLTISIMWGITLIGTGVAPLLILGTWSKRINKYGAIAGIIGGPIAFVVVSPFIFPEICVGQGLWAKLGFSGGMFATPLSFILVIAGSLVSEKIPKLKVEIFTLRKETDAMIENMHGWPTISSNRYSGTIWLFGFGCFMLLVLFWSIMPGPWLL